MRIVEPKKTKKYGEHAILFGKPGYFDRLTATSTTFWGAARTLRVHPASLGLFLNKFVESFPPSDNLREEIKGRFFMQNERVHDAIATRLYNDSSVLDLGAGVGCLKDMLDMHGKVVEYHAHDISERLLGLNPAEDGRKYCCDFEDLYDLLASLRFDFVVDCKATHNRGCNNFEQGGLLWKLSKLGATYIYHGSAEPKIDRKAFRNVVII